MSTDPPSKGCVRHLGGGRLALGYDSPVILRSGKVVGFLGEPSSVDLTKVDLNVIGWWPLQDPRVLPLPTQPLDHAILIARSDNNVGLGRNLDCVDGFMIENTVHRDDATEGRTRITLIGVLIRR